MADEKKKKLYFGMILVDEDLDVKESGAAIRYIDSEGVEQTQQAVMFRVDGTSTQIVEEISQRLLNGLALMEPILVPRDEKRIITRN